MFFFVFFRRLFFFFYDNETFLIFINVRKTKKLMNKQQPAALDALLGAESSWTPRVVPKRGFFFFFFTGATGEK